MNSKVSFVNFKYLIENFKKSKGVILVLSLLIPVFTILFMLVLDNSSQSAVIPTLSDLSIPSIIGMYIIPFILSATLFSFIFKRDSVDFVNALPISRKTLYITNVIGGIIIFTLVFSFTAVSMAVFSNFFDNIIIAPKMYLYYFITFLITYIYVFIVSTLSLSFTGNKLVHIVITLIIAFIPGFLSDLYMSRLYNQSYYMGDSINSVTCDEYCPKAIINNELSVSKSLEMVNGQTLPYKYVSEIPRLIFGISNYELNYSAEQRDVYNFESMVRMIFLSVIYFIIGLYVFNRRKMEIAESSFQSENTHHFVKCLMMLPVVLCFISIYIEAKTTPLLLVLSAIIITIYVVYDLITRKNNVKVSKSFLYLVGLMLSSILLFMIIDLASNFEGSKKINKDDVSNIGINELYQYDYSNINTYSNIDYKITDKKIIDLIFDNVNKNIKVNSSSTSVLVRFTLKNNQSYYFNIILPYDKYDELIDLLSKNKGYSDDVRKIDFDNIYGIGIRNNYYSNEDSKEVINLIKENYKNIDLKKIFINRKEYVSDYQYYDVKLYSYNGSMVTKNISSSLIDELSRYVINLQNKDYITNIKNKKILTNDIYVQKMTRLFEEDFYDNNVDYVPSNSKILYDFINQNIKETVDLVNYDISDYAIFFVNYYGNYSYEKYVYILKDDNYNKMLDVLKNNIIKYLKENNSIYDKDVE